MIKISWGLYINMSDLVFFYKHRFFLQTCKILETFLKSNDSIQIKSLTIKNQQQRYSRVRANIVATSLVNLQRQQETKEFALISCKKLAVISEDNIFIDTNPNHHFEKTR